MQTEQVKGKDQDKDKPGNHVFVAVITTSGSWPAEGFEKIPNHQKVSIFLKKSVEKLEVVSTDGWIAKVGATEIDVENTYLESSLSGEVTIDYGPPEGGGGSNE